jgi:hypothetical protein
MAVFVLVFDEPLATAATGDAQKAQACDGMIWTSLRWDLDLKIASVPQEGVELECFARTDKRDMDSPTTSATGRGLAVDSFEVGLDEATPEQLVGHGTSRNGMNVF